MKMIQVAKQENGKMLYVLVDLCQGCARNIAVELDELSEFDIDAEYLACLTSDTDKKELMETYLQIQLKTQPYDMVSLAYYEIDDRQHIVATDVSGVEYEIRKLFDTEYLSFDGDPHELWDDLMYIKHGILKNGDGFCKNPFGYDAEIKAIRNRILQSETSGDAGIYLEKLEQLLASDYQISVLPKSSTLYEALVDYDKLIPTVGIVDRLDQYHQDENHIFIPVVKSEDQEIDWIDSFLLCGAGDGTQRNLFSKVQQFL